MRGKAFRTLKDITNTQKLVDGRRNRAKRNNAKVATTVKSSGESLKEVKKTKKAKKNDVNSNPQAPVDSKPPVPIDSTKKTHVLDLLNTNSLQLIKLDSNYEFLLQSYQAIPSVDLQIGGSTAALHLPPQEGKPNVNNDYSNHKTDLHQKENDETPIANSDSFDTLIQKHVKKEIDNMSDDITGSDKNYSSTGGDATCASITYQG